MKNEIKSQIKGALKAIAAIAILGIMIGVGYATTVITDEGIWVDGSAVIVEGDYNDWTHVWTEDIPNGLYNKEHLGFFIDEVNEVINIGWDEGGAWYRFMICDISDFGLYFQSPPGVDYTRYYPEGRQGDGIRLGAVGGGGMSRSIQTYLLLHRGDGNTLEVWRGGSELWSHNVTIDESPSTVWIIAISASGKWILVSTTQGKLILYEGRKI